MNDLFNDMLSKGLISVEPPTMPDILRNFGRMLMVGTQPYQAEPKYWQRYAGIYDHLAGRGVLNFPRWIFNNKVEER